MKIAVIDDQLHDATFLSSQLRLYFKVNHPHLSYQIIPFQEEALFLVQFYQNSFDLIFIDYYLNRYNGLALARMIREKDPGAILIFVTTSRDYAIECYKVRASGYLVKPLVYDDLADIMALIDCQKLRARQFIQITSGYEKIKIFLHDIIYCDITGHYTQIHTHTLGVQKSRITFAELTKTLAPYPEFLSCYRGCIINMNAVTEITDLTFLMSNGEWIPFRKKEKAEMLRIYSNWLFEKARSGDL